MLRQVGKPQLQIIQTTGKASLEKTRFFWHGQEKIGKSSLAAGFPNNLFMATEDRLSHIVGVEYIRVRNWIEVLAFTELISTKDYLQKYKIITIDTADNTYPWCTDYICEKRGWEHELDPGFGKGTSMIDREYRKWFLKLMALPYGFQFISHTKRVDIRGLDGSIRTKNIIGLAERARTIILPQIGVIGHLKYDFVTYKDKVTGKIQSKNMRIIDFTGSEIIEAGDGEGKLPPRLVYYKDNKKMYNLIKSYYDR